MIITKIAQTYDYKMIAQLSRGILEVGWITVYPRWIDYLCDLVTVEFYCRFL